MQKIRISFIATWVGAGAFVIAFVFSLGLILNSEWALYKMGFATMEQIQFVQLQSGDDVTMDEIRADIERTEWETTDWGTKHRLFCVRLQGWIIIDDGESYGISKTGGICT
jgi:hypothetical protein